MNEEMKWLVNRAKIQDVITSYAISVDFCDWDRYASIFTEQFDRDFSSFTGTPAVRITREQQVAEAKAGLRGFDSTQHILTNTDISIDNDQAHAIVYMSADHTVASDGEPKQFVLEGFYTFRFVSDGTDWKICGVTLTALSARGDQGVFELAHARAAAMDEAQRNAPRTHSKRLNMFDQT